MLHFRLLQLLPFAFCSTRRSLFALAQTHARVQYHTHAVPGLNLCLNCTEEPGRCHAHSRSSSKCTAACNLSSRNVLACYNRTQDIFKPSDSSRHQLHNRQLHCNPPRAYAGWVGYSDAVQWRSLAVSSTSQVSPLSIGAIDDRQGGANAQARAITRSIGDAKDLQQLQQIVERQGISFNAIHTAAAFARAAKLAEGSTNSIKADAGSTAEVVHPLLTLLAPIWQRCLQDAAPRELASVLYACTKLACTDEQLWSSTLFTLMQPEKLQQANMRDLGAAVYAVAKTAGATAAESPSQDYKLLGGQDVCVFLQCAVQQVTMLLRGSAAADASCQSISYVLWAHAQLGCSLAEADLTVLMQALAHRTQPAASISAADVRATASSLWSISHLQQQTAVGQEQQQREVQHKHPQQHETQQAEGDCIWAQLLGQELLDRIAQGSPQSVSATLFALARLSSGPWHPISVPVAQHCADVLLNGRTAMQLNSWNAQDIGSSMWACGKLGIKDLKLFERAAASSGLWLANAMAPVLSQVAWACARLKYRNQQLIDGIIQQGRHIMHRNHGHVPLLPDQADRTALAATLSWTVATLNMMQLAGDIKALISASGIKQQDKPLTAADARALWHVHGWLHHHQLLGGHGLSKLLTEQQLASCAEASRHTHRHTPPASVAVQTAAVAEKTRAEAIRQ